MNNIEDLFKNSPSTQAYIALKRKYKKLLEPAIIEFRRAKLHLTSIDVTYPKETLSAVASFASSLISQINQITDRRENVVIHMDVLKHNLREMMKLVESL